MNWFRFHTSTLDNPKINALPDCLFRVWIKVLCIISIESAQNSGVLPSIPDLAFRLRATRKQTEKWIEQLIGFRLLDETEEDGQVIVTAHDWDEYQYTSDNSTQRWRKWKANVGPTLAQTTDKRWRKRLTNVATNGPDTEQIQNRTDERHKRELVALRARPQNPPDEDNKKNLLLTTKFKNPKRPTKDELQAAIAELAKVKTMPEPADAPNPEKTA